MRHMKYFAGIVAGLLLASASLAAPVTAHNPLVASGVVYRVIDGDTFVVNLTDPAAFARMKQDAGSDRRRLRHLDDRYSSIRVRLANIDTPESVHANAAMNTQAGKEASNQVRQLLEKKPVTVRCHDWGTYGRSICNIEVSINGRPADLGLWLIENGHSDYVTRWGNNPYYHGEYTMAK